MIVFKRYYSRYALSIRDAKNLYLKVWIPHTAHYSSLFKLIRWMILTLPCVYQTHRASFDVRAFTCQWRSVHKPNKILSSISEIRDFKAKYLLVSFTRSITFIRIGISTFNNFWFRKFLLSVYPIIFQQSYEARSYDISILCLFCCFIWF